MKVDIAQESFTAGKLSTTLFGRVDNDRVSEVNPSRRYINIPKQYENACETIENFLIRTQGSLISCPGTEFINDAKNSGPDNRDDGNGINDDTLLLLHADGEDESQVFIDSSPYARTVEKSNNEPEIDTSQLKFGSGSLSFPREGLSSGIWETITADNSDGTLSNPGTVETWFRIETLGSGSGRIALVRNGTDYVGTTDGWAFEGVRVSTTEIAWVYLANNGGTGNLIVSPDIVTSVNTWHHIALTVESATTVRMFFNGVKIHTETSTKARPESTTDLSIRSNMKDGTTWMDEYRISEPTRYTDDFTLATAPFSNASNVRARLINFIYSRTDSYIIEMGVGYLRVYTNGAVVEE